MITEELSRGSEPGNWQLMLMDEFAERPYYTAMVRCPECARRFSLVNHTIAADGHVSPLIGHPETDPPCTWHPALRLVRLVGWPNLPDPPQRPIVAHCARCQKPTRQLGGWGTWGNPGLICPECRVITNGVP